MTTNKHGYLYVLSNPLYPSLKIGFTCSDTPESRAIKLYSTGVPAPFKVIHSVYVDRANNLEVLVHHRLMNKRENKQREFFNCDIASVKQVIVESMTSSGIKRIDQPKSIKMVREELKEVIKQDLLVYTQKNSNAITKNTNESPIVALINLEGLNKVESAPILTSTPKNLSQKNTERVCYPELVAKGKQVYNPINYRNRKTRQKERYVNTACTQKKSGEGIGFGEGVHLTVLMLLTAAFIYTIANGGSGIGWLFDVIAFFVLAAFSEWATGQA